MAKDKRKAARQAEPGMSRKPIWIRDDIWRALGHLAIDANGTREKLAGELLAWVVLQAKAGKAQPDPLKPKQP